jgi:hypothetical protein
MGRAILALIAAEALWTALWIGFTTLLGRLDPQLNGTVPITSRGVLAALLGYSVVISLAAGYVCAAVRRDNPMKTVWVFAFIQLSLGIGFQASAWSLMPVWYHLSFLLLLIPTTVAGGRLRAGG